MSHTADMDNLDPARALVVEAIATLENATEAMIPGQAPRSSDVEISNSLREIRATADQLIALAREIESALNLAKR